METVEKTENEIIAEFMGEDSSNPFLYNEYWESLMPVVEKIEMFARVKIRGFECEIQSIHDEQFYELEIKATKMQAVYSAVISFINWYNSNKK